ncbi:hypothetical protein KAX35_01360, partial [candidate division WOR-3 bacterium]|nr:hypothetical protein [candidate division WOR-3 bacterium]
NIWAAWKSSYYSEDKSFDSTCLHTSLYNGSNWIEPMRVFITDTITHFIWDSHLSVSINSTVWIGFSVCAYYMGPVPETTWIYTAKYDSNSWSSPMLVQTYYEQTEPWPYTSLVTDSNGKMWLTWDSKADHTSYVYYSIWNGDTWTDANPVDTLSGERPAIAYDPYRDRIWVAWESRREGYPAVYVSYAQATGIEEATILPSYYYISNVSPNPFRNETVISLECINRVDATVTWLQHSIKIYDLTGRLIRTFNLCNPCKSVESVIWDGRDDLGRKVTTGVYFVKFDADPIRDLRSYGAGEFSKTRKVILIR